MPRTLTVTISLLLAMVVIGCGEDAEQTSAVVDLAGRVVDPLQSAAPLVVLMFTRTDCPISNRYAPEIGRLTGKFAGRGVDFWLVYPDPDTTGPQIREHQRQYGLTCAALRDPGHELVDRAGATVTPEAVVYGPGRRLLYRGRIDDRYADLGQARVAATRHDLEDAIEAALAGEPIVASRTKAVGCFIVDLPRQPP